MLNDQCIDYILLSKAANGYEELGYEQINVPWVVSDTASMITCPSLERAFATTNKEHLVGSAEQGFIQLMMDKSNKIKGDKFYYSISPCFRREPEDDLHAQWFMKLELFYKVEKANPEDILNAMISDAMKVMEDIMSNYVWPIFLWDLEVTSDTSADLLIDGVEYGSYGYRTMSHNGETHTWVYGTGIALPRFQVAIEKRLNMPEKDMRNRVPLLIKSNTLFNKYLVDKEEFDTIDDKQSVVGEL